MNVGNALLDDTKKVTFVQRTSVDLLKLQIGKLSKKSRDKEEEKMIFHLLDTCSAHIPIEVPTTSRFFMS